MSAIRRPLDYMGRMGMHIRLYAPLETWLVIRIAWLYVIREDARNLAIMYIDERSAGNDDT
jgi:hypothetical protein